MTKCPVCGSESQNNEEICKNCGSKLPKKKTEKTVVEQKDTKFCPKCGAKSQSNVTQQEQKSPFIA